MEDILLNRKNCLVLNFDGFSDLRDCLMASVCPGHVQMNHIEDKKLNKR